MAEAALRDFEKLAVFTFLSQVAVHSIHKVKFCVLKSNIRKMVLGIMFIGSGV